MPLWKLNKKFFTLRKEFDEDIRERRKIVVIQEEKSWST